jgi:ketosteroid isomerase-like protein
VAKQDVEALERQFNAAMEEADTGSALDAARRIYAEFDRGGAEATAGLLHPKFELHMETLFLDGKVYKGPNGFAQWRETMQELFEEDSFQPQGIRFGQGGFVVLGRLRVKNKKTGVEVDEPLAHHHEQREGKLARLTMYSDIDRALEAAGIA